MTLQLTVPNMACSACSETITQAVKAIDPTATVHADPKTKLVNVETQTSESVIKQAIIDAGYTVAEE
ncbi:heavy-metal-associated domain-containing protein [Cyanobacteria bacterium FACHB-DQ100]|uniref:heavy-metal-associated domain-containing protein n=1 Tax=Leptolyngbya sp. DQ-M1 TaxID=2933920 RepID=UPI001990A037|nr:heavy-metal-associated domain-containing protein [Cyanobacteria bacterium FACHB-DQ100]